MRVVAAACVRNEEDIIEAFVRHTACFCDAIIILDHGSTDATPEILGKLKAEGIPLHLVFDPTVGHLEATHINRLLKLAAHEFSADWILGLDADEFIDGCADRSFLPPVEEERTPCLKLRTRTYYVHAGDDGRALNPIERITHRLLKEPFVEWDPVQFKVFVPGWLARKEGASYMQGKHLLMVDGNEAIHRVAGDVWLGHFSLRSPCQYAMKLASKQIQKFHLIAAGGDDVDFYDKHYEVLRKSYPAFVEKFPAMRVSYHRSGDDSGELVRAPLRYRGGPLRHTSPGQDAHVLIRDLLDFSERLARNTPNSTESAPAPGGKPKQLTFEAQSHPVPGHKTVQPVAVDSAGFQVVRFPLDCPPGTTEFALRLISEPGMVEIRKITLRQEKEPAGELVMDAEAVKQSLRVTNGGAIMWSGTGGACRMLVSKDAVAFNLANRANDSAMTPDTLLIDFRYEQQAAALFLSPPVLNAFNADRNDIANARAELASALDRVEKLTAQIREIAPFSNKSKVHVCHPGSVIDFTDRGNALLFQGHGWNAREPWGTWTEGNQATLNISFSESFQDGCFMRVRAKALVHPLQPEMRVDVSINAKKVATWVCNSGEWVEFREKIPAGLLPAEGCEIVFDMTPPKSPAEMGVSIDGRRLGIGVARIDFKKCKTSPVSRFLGGWKGVVKNRVRPALQ
jgi:hypothetical protein